MVAAILMAHSEMDADPAIASSTKQGVTKVAKNRSLGPRRERCQKAI
ncbi:hypothetical protein [Aerococcus kribbianus]|uniref:Uncharacterized protein n=1 Tax=Aerococcus kribbianus TaxID=2999064 RepID=A0A9X3FVG9_9LACT|nr:MULTISPECIES: hypothetical protein [unclassified Aerococcus]MCZ0717686.1 hypothetical protein [Aerococcus sp. YH-aer221]MCZ0725974.1 hypothetical protein [Aerococcus sp. YH-aer222]